MKQVKQANVFGEKKTDRKCSSCCAFQTKSITIAQEITPKISIFLLKWKNYILKSNNSQTYGHNNVTAKQTLNGDFIIKRIPELCQAECEIFLWYIVLFLSFVFQHLTRIHLFMFYLFTFWFWSRKWRGKNHFAHDIITRIPKPKLIENSRRTNSALFLCCSSQVGKKKHKNQNLVSNFWIHDDFLMKWTVIGRELLAFCKDKH